MENIRFESYGSGECCRETAKVLLMFQGMGQGLNLSVALAVFTAERVLCDCSAAD